MQERLTNGTLSLAAKLQKALNVSAAVAPAGAAWQEVYRQSRSPAAKRLPAGAVPQRQCLEQSAIVPMPAFSEHGYLSLSTAIPIQIWG